MCGRRYEPDERYIITICHGCKKTIKEIELEDDILKFKCPRCGKVWVFESKVVVRLK